MIGCFMLLLGLALLLAVFLLTDVSALPMVDRCALVFLELAEMGMGIVFLRIGKVSRVEVDGERMYNGTPTFENAFRGVPVWGTVICFVERNRTKLCCIPFTEPSADNIFLCRNRWLGDKFS